MILNPLDYKIADLNKIEPEKGRLLIAEPFMADSYFKRSVVLLAAYSDNDVVGFILNKPLHTTLDKVLPFHLKLKQLMKKISDPSWLKEMLVRALMSNSDYEALQSGRFQQSGELHKHMYDRISIKELLQKIGFVKCTIQSHTSSFFPEWEDFNLDNTSQGEARKPDSLFIEAVKPE